MLKLINLTVFTEKKKIILKKINFFVNESELHIIIGKNGSGKSSLVRTITGHYNYNNLKGNIFFKNIKINNALIHIRSYKGLFLSFQHPQEINGLTIYEYLETIFFQKKNNLSSENKKLEFLALLYSSLELLQIYPKNFLNRAINSGFSGGEQKKNEFLQMLILNPKLAFFDEIDSGIDIDTTYLFSRILKIFIKKKNSAIVITHYPYILSNILETRFNILKSGTLIQCKKNVV